MRLRVCIQTIREYRDNLHMKTQQTDLLLLNTWYSSRKSFKVHFVGDQQRVVTTQTMLAITSGPTYIRLLGRTITNRGRK